VIKIKLSHLLTGGGVALLAGGLWLGRAPQAHAERGPSVVGVQQAMEAVKPVLSQAAVGYADGVTLTGTVLFTDDFKTLPPVVKKGDGGVKDPAVCSAEEVPDESLVIGPNKGIANVFIFLAKAPAGYKAEVPKEEVTFDQKGCRFLPHTLLVQAGQTVKILSDDPIPHNTHTFPLRNSGFNQSISPNDRKGVELKYTKAEKLPIEVKCDFHAWMKAYHLILDHPFMAVTDAEGKFEIKNLPAGKHEFVVWHEKKGYLDRKFAVEAKGPSTSVELKYGAKNFAKFEGPKAKTVLVSLTENN
jgi:plastocyanin